MAWLPLCYIPLISSKFAFKVFISPLFILTILTCLLLLVHDGQQSRDLLPSSKSAAKTGHFGTFTLDYVKQLLRASSRSKGYSSQSLLSRLNIIRSTLYQGVVPNFIGATLSWGLYFSFYTAIKDLWPKNVRSTDAVDTLAPAPMKLAEYFAASCIAGLMTLSLTNPIWVVKTRMCLESNPLISDSTPYRSILGSLKEIYQSQGLKGFYCGFLPGILGITHGGIQFALYEQLKVLAHSLRPATGLMSARNEPLNTLNSTEIMLISSVSKLAASLVTYPYQVLRSRLQDVRGDTRHIPYSGFFDVVHRTFRY